MGKCIQVHAGECTRVRVCKSECILGRVSMGRLIMGKWRVCM